MHLTPCEIFDFFHVFYLAPRLGRLALREFRLQTKGDSDTRTRKSGPSEAPIRPDPPDRSVALGLDDDGAVTALISIGQGRLMRH